MRAARWFYYLVWNVVLAPTLLAGMILLFIPAPRRPEMVVPAVLVGAIIQAWHVWRYVVHRREAKRLMALLDPGHAAAFAGRLEEAEKHYRNALVVEGGLI